MGKNILIKIKSQIAQEFKNPVMEMGRKEQYLSLKECRAKTSVLYQE